MTTSPTEGESRRRYRRHQSLSLVAAVLVGFAVGAATLSLASVSTPAELSAGTPVPPGPRDDARAPAAPSAALPPGLVPVRLRIPSLGLDAPVVRVDLNARRELEVPSDFGAVGWYSGGPRPGEVGPAVIAGHVDSFDGPAVFFRLRDLDRGDRVVVEYDGGRRAEFRVYHRGEYGKDAFPTTAVYANTEAPELRLITCGGPFDRSSGRYANNVVVWARADV